MSQSGADRGRFSSHGVSRCAIGSGRLGGRRRRLHCHLDAAEFLRSIPIDRLMIESNAPGCAPAPPCGRRGEPSHLPLIADALAAAMNIDRAELRARTSENALRRFGLPAPVA